MMDTGYEIVTHSLSLYWILAENIFNFNSL